MRSHLLTLHLHPPYHSPLFFFFFSPTVIFYEYPATSFPFLALIAPLIHSPVFLSSFPLGGASESSQVLSLSFFFLSKTKPAFGKAYAFAEIWNLSLRCWGLFLCVQGLKFRGFWQKGLCVFRHVSNFVGFYEFLEKWRKTWNKGVSFCVIFLDLVYFYSDLWAAWGKIIDLFVFDVAGVPCQDPCFWVVKGKRKRWISVVISRRRPWQPARRWGWNQWCALNLEDWASWATQPLITTSDPWGLPLSSIHPYLKKKNLILLLIFSNQFIL